MAWAATLPFWFWLVFFKSVCVSPSPSPWLPNLISSFFTQAFGNETPHAGHCCSFSLVFTMDACVFICGVPSPIPSGTGWGINSPGVSSKATTDWVWIGKHRIIYLRQQSRKVGIWISPWYYISIGPISLGMVSLDIVFFFMRGL